MFGTGASILAVSFICVCVSFSKLALQLNPWKRCSYTPGEDILVSLRAAAHRGPGGEAFMLVLYAIEMMEDGSILHVGCGSGDPDHMVRRRFKGV